jgi:AraC-like DNA-binding protein
MIVIDPRHLSDVDFNLYAVTALPRIHGAGERQAYADRGRPDHGLCLVTSGDALYTDDEGKSVVAEKGDVIYIPRGRRYEVVFEKDVTDILVNFMISDAQARELSLADDILRLARGAGEDIVDLFSNLASRSVGAGSAMSVKTLLFDLMDRLLSQMDIAGEPYTMEMCVSYINANYAKIDGVAPLAALCRLGETAFRRRFREHMGMSPIHYINAVKVERACRMLLSSELTAAEVSARLGFYDLAYFHKVFKRYTDKTPGEYVAEHCGKGSGHRR